MESQANITIKKLQEKIELLQEEIRKCNNAHNTIITNLMHEIRTPLNGVVGFSEVIDDPGLSNDERKQYSDLIIESSYALLNIINDVIDITKLQAGKYRTYRGYFDFNELMAVLYNHYKPLAEKKKLQLFLENVMGKSLAVWSDREALERVLRKLIDNAIKFTKEGWIKIYYSEDENNTLNIYVEDTGLGIPVEIQEILFTRFTSQMVSQSRNLGGSGIDLSLCYGIVKVLDGEISVSSAKGSGSSFKITLRDYK
ncbi:MAG: HAMP domain-containing histidine kinase [Prolixibacteraceae bacterium]|nr:HAMP domain-containing histidine kinase [Prolixibacteraceae bacterium]